jgi:plastocyanin
MKSAIHETKGTNMKKVLASLVVVATALVVGANLPAETKANPTMVKMDNFTFTPQTLTVRSGTTVTWVNKDDVPHTVTSTDKKFKSRALDTDERFSFTFSAPGTYNYFCSVHPHMTGKVIVR